MTLSWNEIRTRAVAFSNEWKDEIQEHAEAKSFWDSFFNVFGISRRRIATFEQSVKKLNDNLAMPPKLIKAHQTLDKAVDLCYRPQPFTNERNRIEFLFDLYEQYTAPLMVKKKGKRK